MPLVLEYNFKSMKVMPGAYYTSKFIDNTSLIDESDSFDSMHKPKGVNHIEQNHMPVSVIDTRNIFIH